VALRLLATPPGGRKGTGSHSTVHDVPPKSHVRRTSPPAPRWRRSLWFQNRRHAFDDPAIGMQHGAHGGMTYRRGPFEGAPPHGETGEVRRRDLRVQTDKPMIPTRSAARAVSKGVHMTHRYDVRITLTSQLQKCPNGHRIGDQWLIERKTPSGLCLGLSARFSPSSPPCGLAATSPGRRRVRRQSAARILRWRTPFVSSAWATPRRSELSSGIPVHGAGGRCTNGPSQSVKREATTA
jgi:hypothetical protein